jgi:small subunit ribosomal protein S14
MKIKKIVIHDKERRKVYKTYKNKRLTLRRIIHNRKLSKIIRWTASKELSNMTRNGSKTRIRNRCVLTGRGRAISRLFRVSRIKIRELGGMGKLPGLRKSSW